MLPLGAFSASWELWLFKDSDHGEGWYLACSGYDFYSSSLRGSFESRLSGPFTTPLASSGIPYPIPWSSKWSDERGIQFVLQLFFLPFFSFWIFHCRYVGSTVVIPQISDTTFIFFQYSFLLFFRLGSFYRCIFKTSQICPWSPPANLTSFNCMISVCFFFIISISLLRFPI